MPRRNGVSVEKMTGTKGGPRGLIRTMDKNIRIRGARQHNLKNLDLDLPHRALTVITGPSGSGKSSLALDTLFAEGQRRYVESLSSYAKQFLDRMEKPDVDSVEGIAPAVAIEQKNPTKSSRSTVGTSTEVYDYLRLLWARVGRTHCPECDRQVKPDTVAGAVDGALALPNGTRFMVTFPLRTSGRMTSELIAENLRAMGFVRGLVDGEAVDFGTEPFTFDLAGSKEVLVVVDRLAIAKDATDADRDEIRERLADSVHTAFSEGEGECVVVVPDGKRLAFTERFRCPDHPEMKFADPTPQLFSFNNPYGSCPTCTGFGANLEYSLDLIVPVEEKSIDGGAVDPWTKPRYHKERDKLRAFTLAEGHSLYTPWKDLPQEFRDRVIQGEEGAEVEEPFTGLIPFLVSREKKRYKQYIRVFPSPVSAAHGVPGMRRLTHSKGRSVGQGRRRQHRPRLAPAT